MTITSEERELLDMLHKAMPERKNLMLITLTAGAHLDGITEFELPQCSRAEYKRHIKALRQMQHTDPIRCAVPVGAAQNTNGYIISYRYGGYWLNELYEGRTEQ